MTHQAWSNITNSIQDTDLAYFHGRIERYDVLQGTQSFDRFMRHCVSNRLLHEVSAQAAISTTLADDADVSPDYDVLRVAG